MGLLVRPSVEPTRPDSRKRLVCAFAERLPVQVMRPSIVVGDERSGWTPSYFEGLLSFALWAGWGRRPVGRAEARAARTRGPEPALAA